MSGISEIKKKAKLSIDEMYDNQSVGNMEIQEGRQPENQEAIQPEKNIVRNTDNKETIQPSIHTDGKNINQTTEHLESPLDNRQDFQRIRQSSIFTPPKQQTQKLQTYKMTFNLTEDIYKAFNDLYAHRMLQGRKTDKSELICEAIQWLVKMENERTE